MPMRALRFSDGQLSIGSVPVPERDGEALVRVTISGICNTDIEIARGYAGFEGTIGHEFVGIIERSPDAVLAGKRVVGEINAGCGECPLCVADDPRHCPRRTVLGIVGRDGAHAQFVSLPMRNLIAVPDDITDEQVVFAEPLAAAAAILEQVPLERSSKVAVIGDGKLGLLCSFVMATVSDDVLLIGKHSDKLLHAADRGIETMLVDRTAGLERAFDVVVEASGSETGFASALQLVRPRGTIVLKSTFHGAPVWDASRVVVDEITVVGSRCGRLEHAIQLMNSRAFDLRDLISDQFALTDGIRAMERAQDKGVLKVLLRP